MDFLESTDNSVNEPAKRAWKSVCVKGRLYKFVKLPPSCSDGSKLLTSILEFFVILDPPVCEVLLAAGARACTK